MKIDLVKLVEEVYKLEGEPKNVNKVFALTCLQAFKEQLTLNGVVVSEAELVCEDCQGYGWIADENGRRKDHCYKCD